MALNRLEPKKMYNQWQSTNSNTWLNQIEKSKKKLIYAVEHNWTAKMFEVNQFNGTRTKTFNYIRRDDAAQTQTQQNWTRPNLKNENLTTENSKVVKHC